MAQNADLAPLGSPSWLRAPPRRLPGDSARRGCRLWTRCRAQRLAGPHRSRHDQVGRRLDRFGRCHHRNTGYRPEVTRCLTATSVEPHTVSVDETVAPADERTHADSATQSARVRCTADAATTPQPFNVSPSGCRQSRLIHVYATPPERRRLLTVRGFKAAAVTRTARPYGMLIYRGPVTDEDSLVIPAPWWRRVHLGPGSVGSV